LDRPPRQPREWSDHAPADPDEPIFDDYDERDLPAGVRAELKGVAPEAAHTVGGHLRMAALLVDDDPATALKHALAAKRRAGRLQVVREAVAEAAYAAEDFRLAASEYQALRRMTGDENVVPVLADCQRALGKPAAALDLLAEADTAKMNSDQRIEAVIVAAGARQDLGQLDEAQRLLRDAIATRRGGRIGQARLRYAYAAALEAGGDSTVARTWFVAASELDQTTAPDALRRVDMLDGKPVDDEVVDPEDDIAVDEELGDEFVPGDDESDEDTDDDAPAEPGDEDDADD